MDSSDEPSNAKKARQPPNRKHAASFSDEEDDDKNETEASSSKGEKSKTLYFRVKASLFTGHSSDDDSYEDDDESENESENEASSANAKKNDDDDDEDEDDDDVHEVVKPSKEPRNANDDDEQPKKNKWLLLDSSDDDEEEDDDDVHEVVAKSNAKAAANAKSNAKAAANAKAASNANAARDSSKAKAVLLLRTLMEQFEADKVTADKGESKKSYSKCNGDFYPPKCSGCGKKLFAKSPKCLVVPSKFKEYVLYRVDHLIKCEGTCPEIKSKMEALKATLEAADPFPAMDEAEAMVKAEWERFNPGKKFEEFDREAVAVAKAGTKATKGPGRKTQNERAPAARRVERVVKETSDDVAGHTITLAAVRSPTAERVRRIMERAADEENEGGLGNDDNLTVWSALADDDKGKASMLVRTSKDTPSAERNLRHFFCRKQG